MNYPILYEDQDVLVLNKPAGVVVNDAQSNLNADTIQQWMDGYLQTCDEVPEAEWQAMIPEDFDDQYGSPLSIFLERRGMVHRLDKNTSGALVLAKHPGSLVHLLAQFREREVQKEYQCLVHGFISPSEGSIDAPIGRSSIDRKKFAVVPQGRPAVTLYKVEQLFDSLLPERVNTFLGSQAGEIFLEKTQTIYQGFSLVRCFPKTGRTHQIRVHFSHINHPLVGDVHYVGRKRQKLDPRWCPRHFLHASNVLFKHPRTGKEVSIHAPMPAELDVALSLLKNIA